MTFSEAEIRAIAKRAADDHTRPSWAPEMRRMLKSLARLEFQPARASSLVKLCEAGARYGWRRLESASDPDLLTRVSPKAKASLRRDLRRSLERLTRPCFELERTCFGLATKSMGILPGPEDPKLVDRMFLGDRPSHRLFTLFNEFPVLARLWSEVISQWREHVSEVLSRFVRDRRALAGAFLGGEPAGTIVNLRCSLSDPHNRARIVMELQLEAGAVIYKPRPGDGEWEWGSLLEWMNAHSFQPKLRPARLLRRKGYCWMERIEAAPSRTRAAARRFHERLGGLIAAAYLLRAVDCHRDNLVASGEDPVLVDAEALWHASPDGKTQTPFDLLSQTGFFPNSNRRSLQSRSSFLTRTHTGEHVARLDRESLDAVQYEREIVKGFRRAWHCILGTAGRRRAFAQRVRRIRSRERRWIYRATERYAAIRRASIQPAALRHGIERDRLLARLLQRSIVAPEVIESEIDALRRLDIPYFLRGSNERVLPDGRNIPVDIRKYLRRLLV